MADPHARRHDAKALERLLSPIEQCVAFPIATIFPLEIRRISIGAAKSIDLHGVIDDQIDRDEWIDSLRISTGIAPPRFSTRRDRRLPERR